jgi:hypothetical protein
MRRLHPDVHWMRKGGIFLVVFKSFLVAHGEANERGACKNRSKHVVKVMVQAVTAAEAATRPQGARHGRRGETAARGAAEASAAGAISGILTNRQG